MQYQIIASEQFNSLSVSLKNGQIVEFLLDDMPVVKFDKDKMIVKSLLIQSEFPKENIKGFSYSTSSRVNDLANEASLRFEYHNKVLTIYGVNPNSAVNVCTLDGKEIITDLVSDNIYQISFEDYATGVYFVTIKNHTIKIIR